VLLPSTASGQPAREKIARNELCHVVLMNRRLPAADLLSLSPVLVGTKEPKVHTTPSHPPDEFFPTAHALHTSPSVEISMGAQVILTKKRSHFYLALELTMLPSDQQLKATNLEESS
jgi:hypothetical protein